MEDSGGVLLEPPDEPIPGQPEGTEPAEGGEQQRTGLGPRHQRVAALLTQLASTARSFLLYDAHNAAIQRFITTLLQGFLSALKDEGLLDLEVQPFELRFLGEAVYLNRDRERSLAFRLYRDGVRALKFRDGFDWEELAKLLEILSIRYTGVHQQEDDVVTLLWKANFKHLDIVAVEGFIPEDADGMDAATPAGGGSFSLPDDIDLPMPAPRRPSEPSWVPVSDAARQALRDEASAVALPSDCLLLLRRLRPLLDDPGERATLTELGHIFGEIRDFLLSDETLESLAGLIRIVGEMAETAAPAWDPERPATAAVLLSSCADERAVRRLLHSVPAEERTPRPELVEILDRACPDPFGAVAAAHAAETGQGSRAVARELLARYGFAKLDVLHDHFEKARGHVALDLFRVIVRVGGEAEAIFCAHQVSHPDVEVQEEAVQALGSMPHSGILGRALFDAFRRASAAQRPRILALMARSKDRRFVEGLADYVQTAAGRLAPEEAAEIGRVLGELGGPGSLARWQDWLKPSGLLRKELHAPLAVQVAAATALGEIPGDESAETLRTALHVAGPDAGAWIRQALAHHGRAPVRKTVP